MTNTEELEKKIIDSGLKKGFLAKELNLSRSGFKKKRDNVNPFTATEIALLCKLLNITELSEKEKIFFA